MAPDLPAACPASAGMDLVKAGQCWADKRYIVSKELVPCKAEVSPNSPLGLCVEHDGEIRGRDN